MYKRSFSRFSDELINSNKDFNGTRTKSILADKRIYQDYCSFRDNTLDYDSLNDHIDKIMNRITKHAF